MKDIPCLRNPVLVYKGSVKRLWSSSTNKNLLWFEFTDKYSVFDWGEMPDELKNKGRSLAIMGAFFFKKLEDATFWAKLPHSPYLKRFDSDWLKERFAQKWFQNTLSKTGLPHHFCGLTTAEGKKLSLKEAAATNENIYFSVQKVDVNRPKPVLVMGQTIYHYPQHPTDNQVCLIPLEVVFRFGMPPGSSLKSRLESSPSYASVLGLKKIPGDKEWFDKSVIEFFTKLENKDRLLSLQEAHRISGLTPEMFKDLLELVQLISLALFHIFAELGIELWDGKLEFAQVNEQLMLVDSIGPDELRLQVKGQNLSKEFIRQFYRHSKWFIAVHEAQKIAKEQGRIDWKELCQQTLQAVPEPLPENLKVLAQQLYTVLTNTLLGEDLFSHQPSLQELAELISHSTGQKQHAC